MMYMRDFDLMATYAYALRASNRLSEDNIDSILARMEVEGIYRPRNGGSTFTGTFKSIQIAWYMFGHYNKRGRKDEEKKLVFSPLGNLLLDNLKDRDKTSRIFLTMLHGNGFRQPFSQMDERFNVYGFRLIFQLLRDARLDGRLYDDEVFYYVMFVKSIDAAGYEQLVADILACRRKAATAKLAEFKRNERLIGLACHEWRYAAGMLQSAGILDIHEGEEVGKLTYGSVNPQTGRHSAIRSYRKNYVTLRPELVPLADSLLATYPFDVKPYPVDEIARTLNSAIVVEMYSFYPPELLKELGMDTEEDKAIAAMLQIASDVKYYSHKETSTGVNFENALTDAFNMFCDVEAERIGGSGNADIECVYYPTGAVGRKFDIEAKSTSRKLLQINSRRLRAHRAAIGSGYTVIVAPNYAIGVLADIRGEQSVIVKAATLANFFYQYVLRYGRNLSYMKLDEIARAHLGGDMTDSVNAHVYSNFGHSADDFRIGTRKL